MRKTIIPLLILTLVLSLAAAGCGSTLGGNKNGGNGGNGNGGAAADVPLYEQGLKVVEIMEKKLDSPEYISLMLSDSDGIKDTDIFEKLKNTDYSVPDKIYNVVFPDGLIENLIMGAGYGELSDDLKSLLGQQAFVSSFPMLVSANQGAQAAAMASLFSGSRLFVDKSGKGNNLLCLYCYKDSYPAAVTFACGDDGATLAEGRFMIIEDFRYDDEKAVADSLSVRFPTMKFEIEVEEVGAK